MDTDRWADRLSEYVDDDLAAREREELELHLLECESCADAVADLREIQTQASALGDRAPTRDLWPGIEGHLAPRAAPDGPGERHALASSEPTAPEAAPEALAESGDALVRPLAGDRWRRERRIALTVPQLLAAGIALVVLSAGSVWLVTSPDPAPPGAIAARAPYDAASGVRPAAQVPAAVRYTAAYEDAITELETVFEQRRERLEPETILVVERNLAIIDTAIEEARRALEEDPASGFLNTYLADAMRRKVDLLRQATRIERTQI